MTIGFDDQQSLRGSAPRETVTQPRPEKYRRNKVAPEGPSI